MTSDSTNMDFIKDGKGNPFRIPSGYFEDSKVRIMDKILSEPSTSSAKEIRLRARMLWISGIAASLLIGLLLFQNLYIKPHREIRMAQELNWFINSAGSDLNEVSLASYLADEGIVLDDIDQDILDLERSSLLEMTDYGELFIIEEWMKIEDQ